MTLMDRMIARVPATTWWQAQSELCPLARPRSIGGTLRLAWACAKAAWVCAREAR